MEHKQVKENASIINSVIQDREQPELFRNISNNETSIDKNKWKSSKNK